MQSGKRFYDDIASMMTNAMGVAHDARREAEQTFNAWFERKITDRNLVTREEFDAVKTMARKAREENEALRDRIETLEKGSGIDTAME
ncbi:MAG: accessory factor UbiK family protein [Rhodobacteraceae bacterium]|nr:accessory factor UbiK family protein [Paracoccaceae bacterium]